MAKAEPASWGDMIREYRQTSRQAPQPEPMVRFSRSVPRTTGTREFNVLTNEGRPLPPPPVRRYYPNSHREHKEIVLKGKKMLHSESDCPPFAVELKDPPAAEMPSGYYSPQNQRNYDIVAHVFMSEEARNEQLLKDQRRLKPLLGPVSALNPITATYHFRGEELNAVESARQLADKKRHSVSTHTFPVSETVGKSEGHAYDIVAHRVFNPDSLLVLEQHAMRGVPQRANLRMQWEHERDVDEAVADSNHRRALARVSDERQKELMRRGHNILNLKNFGLSFDEERAGVTVDSVIAGETVRPPLSMATLEKGSVATTLHTASMPPKWSPTATTFPDGPRPTAMRVLQTTAPSTAQVTHTYDGRLKLILPTVDKILHASLPRTEH